MHQQINAHIEPTAERTRSPCGSARAVSARRHDDSLAPLGPEDGNIQSCHKWIRSVLSKKPTHTHRQRSGSNGEIQNPLCIGEKLVQFVVFALEICFFVDFFNRFWKQRIKGECKETNEQRPSRYGQSVTQCARTCWRFPGGRHARHIFVLVRVLLRRSRLAHFGLRAMLVQCELLGHVIVCATDAGQSYMAKSGFMLVIGQNGARIVCIRFAGKERAAGC